MPDGESPARPRRLLRRLPRPAGQPDRRRGAAWARASQISSQDTSISGEPNALARFGLRPGRWRLALLLLLHSVPNVVYAISRDVARLLVLNIGVERLLIVGPLLGAVVAGDQSQIADWLVAG